MGKEDAFQVEKLCSLTHRKRLTPRSLLLSAQVQTTCGTPYIQGAAQKPQEPLLEALYWPLGLSMQRTPLNHLLLECAPSSPGGVCLPPYDRHGLDILRFPQKSWDCLATSGKEGDEHRATQKRETKDFRRGTAIGFSGAHWLWGSMGACCSLLTPISLLDASWIPNGCGNCSTYLIYFPFQRILWGGHCGSHFRQGH